MASLIKGITVRIYLKKQVGTDDFKNPIYEETPVDIENVLVSPVDTDMVTSDLQMYGKRSVYELCIPKGDSHDWEDKTVEFFGKKWRTFGFTRQWIEENVPLDWNRKVRVERYG